MAKAFIISPKRLTLSALETVINNRQPIELSEDSRRLIDNCFHFLQRKIRENDNPYYGINTGFGSLCNIQIPDEQISQLQSNLVRSHACGIGDLVPNDIVRLMLFLKIQGLSLGYSGISTTLVERLIQFYNDDALPVIYQLGSLGASGDLAPLAHLSLPIIGEGDIFYKNKKITPPQYLKEKNIKPLQLQAKEGLALLNGTQFCSAYGVWCILQAKRLLKQANLNAAIALDAFHCKIEPFDKKLHAIRAYKGQQQVAADIRDLLRGSEILKQHKNQVQDPYAFRCIPQVHGATSDVIDYVSSIFETEINSVTDNPTIFPDDDTILSGGNFHAQPLAMALDYLAIALSELGSIAERRIFQLVSGQRNLPVYLTKNGGLESGLMIAQYTAASIASQNKQLCTPASADSIVSSNGQEDHVSMGANAATKCYKIVENLERILAIEFLVACQAIEFRRPMLSSSDIEKILRGYRKVVTFIENDRILSEDFNKTIAFLKNI